MGHVQLFWELIVRAFFLSGRGSSLYLLRIFGVQIYLAVSLWVGWVWCRFRGCCRGLSWRALSNCAPTHSNPLQVTPTNSNPPQATPTNSSHFNSLHAALTHCRPLHLLQTTLETQPHAIQNHS